VSSYPSLLQSNMDEEQHVCRVGAHTDTGWPCVARHPWALLASLLICLSLVGCGSSETDVARWRSQGKVRELCKCVRDSRYSCVDVRVAAATALGSFDVPAARAALLDAVCDKHMYVREAAAQSLISRGGAAEINTIVSTNPDFGVAALAKTAGRTGRADTEPWLIQQLTNNSHYVRRAAAESLGVLKAEAAVLPLIACMEEETDGLPSKVFRAAALSLGEIGTPAARDALIRNLHDDVNYSAPVATALANIGDKAALDALAKLAESQHSNARLVSVATLAKHQDGRALPAIATALADIDTEWRPRYVSLLRHLGPREGAYDQVVECLRDWDSDVRSAAVEVLREIDPHPTEGMAVASLAAALSGAGEASDYSLTEGQIQRIAKALSRSDSKSKACVAYALAKQSHPTAQLVLAELLRDHDPRVRWCTAWFLAPYLAGEPSDAKIASILEGTQFTAHETRWFAEQVRTGAGWRHFPRLVYSLMSKETPAVNMIPAVEQLPTEATEYIPLLALCCVSGSTYDLRSIETVWVSRGTVARDARGRTRNLRSAATETLARYGAKALVPLFEVVGNGDECVNAEFAARVCALIGDVAIPVVSSYLQSGNSGQCNAAESALRRIADK